MYRKSHCTTLSVGIGGSGVGNMLKVFTLQVFLCDRQSADRLAIMYKERSYFFQSNKLNNNEPDDFKAGDSVIET